MGRKIDDWKNPRDCSCWVMSIICLPCLLTHKWHRKIGRIYSWCTLKKKSCTIPIAQLNMQQVGKAHSLTAFVFQSWWRRWCTMMCVRIRRNCRAWSTHMFNRQPPQLSASSKGACTPWSPREATYVPGDLISATRRYGQNHQHASLVHSGGQLRQSVDSWLEIDGGANDCPRFTPSTSCGARSF